MELGSSESDDSQSGEDSEADIKVTFDPKNKGGKKDNKNEKEAKGIMGLKFMQRAEQNKKEILKEQAQMLIDQIKEEQKLLLEEDSEKEEKNFLKAAKGFK